MKKSMPTLKVRLFGTERVAYEGVPIIVGKNNVTKVMKLFLILLYHGEEGISRGRLMENLYGRDELSDAANNLRVSVCRLKKLLTEAGLPEHEYIVSRNGRYYWDSEMETVVDAREFERILTAAEQEGDPAAKALLLRKACDLYKGEFLQKLSGDEWVLLESVRYKDMYSEALQELCDLLMAEKEYEEVLKIVEPACEMYPFDEWQAVRIDCYIAMNRYKEALKEYEATTKFLFEELGVEPSEKMLKQFHHLSDHISSRPEVITEIKKRLRENPEEKGAFFCNYPGFRDAYRVIRRGMERNGQSVFLVLCTLTDTKGRPMENSEKLDEMSEKLHSALQGSLRRCDSFTKYSCSQFLVMLVGTNEENCQIAIDRISNNFSKEHKAWANHLECNVSSLLDVTG